jgi:hypothetical protein
MPGDGGGTGSDAESAAPRVKVIGMVNTRSACTPS